MNVLRTLRWSFNVGIADARAIHTVRSWMLGWMLRVVCQVVFFASIGLLIGPEKVEYLIVGHSVLVGASAVWERRQGTLPLLVSSPVSPFVVFVGRGAQWILEGLVLAMLSLLIAPVVFRIPVARVSILAATPIVLVTLLSVFWMGLFFSAIVLARPHLHSVVANLAALGLMLFTGVNVSVDFWPRIVAVTANILPMTHASLLSVHCCPPESWISGPSGLRWPLAPCGSPQRPCSSPGL